MSNYDFTTIWKIKATREEVYAILEDVESLKRWWSCVHVDIDVTENGNNVGIGKKVKLLTRGLFPFKIKWNFEIVQAAFPMGFVINTFGDLPGKGVLNFTQIDHLTTEVRHEWKMDVTHSKFNFFELFLKPLYKFNRNWAMKLGEDGIKLEILRRRIMGTKNMMAQTA